MIIRHRIQRFTVMKPAQTIKGNYLSNRLMPLLNYVLGLVHIQYVLAQCFVSVCVCVCE